MGVVRPATQFEICHGCGTSHAKRNDMVELEKPCFAAGAVRAGKHTLTAVAIPDLSPDRCRDVTTLPADRLRGTSGCSRLAESRSRNAIQEQRECSIEDEIKVAVRN